MPVRKIRDLREMEDALWREPGDPQLAKAIDSVWRFAAQTCPLRFPPGVYRHRTIEDAGRLREQWEEANFRAFWERRGMRPETFLARLRDITMPRLTRFDQILEDVRATIAWYEELNLRTAKSRLESIERSVLEIVELLARPDAENVFATRSRRKDYWPIVDGYSFSFIWRHLHRLSSQIVPRGSLRRALEGPLDPADEKGADEVGRNHQAELELAAQVLASGFPVTSFDDLGFEFEGVPFRVEMKRLRSDKNLVDTVGSATHQLTKKLHGAESRGLIALSLDKLLGLDDQEPLVIADEGVVERWVFALAGDFRGKHGGVFDGLDQRIIGVILAFRFICHDLRNGGYSVARYQVLMPIPPPGSADRDLARKLGTALATVK